MLTIVGSSVRSPFPHTNRGRSATVSKPSALAAQRDVLGHCLAARVEGLRVRAARGGLVDVDQGVPRDQQRLGADVHETADSRRAAALDGIARAIDVVALELLPWSPLLDLGRRMEGELAARGALGDRVTVGEVAPDGLGPELADALRRPVRARERADLDSVAAECADEAAADEAGAARYEGAGHSVTQGRAVTPRRRAGASEGDALPTGPGASRGAS